MKQKILFTILIVCCLLGGCSQKEQTASKAETYIIPNSFFAFTGSNVNESVESCLELGSDYCTDAKQISDGMQLELTDEQLNNMVKRNDEFINKLVNQFTSLNSMYKCVLDESYQRLTLYFDENISSITEAKTILGITSNYAMNYILLNNTTVWNVHVEIINCHTNKCVVSVNIPSEEVSYGPEEWEESYNV